MEVEEVQGEVLPRKVWLEGLHPLPHDVFGAEMVELGVDSERMVNDSLE